VGCVKTAARWVGNESSESKVKSMSKEKADKKEKAEKPKTGKPQKQAQLGEKSKPKKEKAAKPAADAAAVKEAPKEEKPKPAPRPPADLRLKVLKKFHGKFLPRGPLRDRHKALMTRWASGEDHGGVTLEELKSLHEDWKAARAKPPRKVAALV
jgi:hypothetical protein